MVKLIKAEPGHELIKSIHDEAGQLATSVIAYAEARAAIARSAKPSSPKDRRSLDALWSELLRLNVDDAVAAEGGALAERHRIRGMDALHLASALRFAAACAPERVIFVSWDRDQRSAARTEGLPLAPPEV